MPVRNPHSCPLTVGACTGQQVMAASASRHPGCVSSDLVFPASRATPKLRAFIDQVVAEFGPHVA
jgi:hypothetical protein